MDNNNFINGNNNLNNNSQQNGITPNNNPNYNNLQQQQIHMVQQQPINQPTIEKPVQQPMNTYNTNATMPQQKTTMTQTFSANQQPINQQSVQQPAVIQPNIEKQNNISNIPINIETTTTQQQGNNQNYTIPNNNIQQVIKQKPINSPEQTLTANTGNLNQDELLKIFIGKNYDKITTKKFNFAGFFLSTLYMFYRKMFLYAIILFFINIIILNIVNNAIISILFNIALGLFINKLYIYYATNQINKIKEKNPQSDYEQLKEICSKKGGTSIGKVFLGLLTETLIAIIVTIIMFFIGIGNAISELINLNNWNTIINQTENNRNDNDTTTNKSENNNSNNNLNLIENVTVTGYGCVDLECNFSIEKSGTTTNYTYKANNTELFKILKDYDDYVRVDIYYSKNGEETIINNYKLFLKSNNEDISDVKTENELRTKIGLYNEGIYTSSLKLSEISLPSFGIKDETSYTYIESTFIDDKNNEYKMRYINTNRELDLVIGNTYNVTFEVVKGSFDYEFIIKSIN